MTRAEFEKYLGKNVEIDIFNGTIIRETLYKTGEEMFNEFNLQKYADSIMPALFPALFAALCYWMLGKKWMNSNKLILVVVLFAIVLAFFGVLA